MTTKTASNKRKSTQPSGRSSKTSTTRDHSAVARKAWQTRRANEARRKAELEAAFRPQRRELVAETISELETVPPVTVNIDDQLDRSLELLAAKDRPRVNWLHIYTTAVTVVAVAQAVAIWG